MSDKIKGSLTRREREKLAHRNEIMEAALRLFAEKGYIPATLEEVAQEAGFSKGGLYLYFENKEGLLYNIIYEKSCLFLKEIKKILTGKKPFRRELTDFFMRNSELAFEEKDFFKLMISMHMTGFKEFSPGYAENLHAVHDEFNRVIFDRIEKALGSGELRPLAPEAIAGMIHGALENMMVTRWELESVDDLKQATEVFMDILFEGIAQKKEKRT